MKVSTFHQLCVLTLYGIAWKKYINYYPWFFLKNARVDWTFPPPRHHHLFFYIYTTFFYFFWFYFFYFLEFRTGVWRVERVLSFSLGLVNICIVYMCIIELIIHNDGVFIFLVRSCIICGVFIFWCDFTNYWLVYFYFWWFFDIFLIFFEWFFYRFLIFGFFFENSIWFLTGIYVVIYWCIFYFFIFNFFYRFFYCNFKNFDYICWRYHVNTQKFHCFGLFLVVVWVFKSYYSRWFI